MAVGVGVGEIVDVMALEGASGRALGSGEDPLAVVSVGRVADTSREEEDAATDNAGAMDGGEGEDEIVSVDTPVIEAPPLPIKPTPRLKPRSLAVYVYVLSEVHAEGMML